MMSSANEFDTAPEDTDGRLNRKGIASRRDARGKDGIVPIATHSLQTFTPYAG
jgi:hypothetical protein